MANERYIIEGELLYWTNDGLGAELELGDVPWPGPDIDALQGKRVRVTIEVLDDLDQRLPMGTAESGSGPTAPAGWREKPFNNTIITKIRKQHLGRSFLHKITEKTLETAS